MIGKSFWEDLEIDAIEVGQDVKQSVRRRRDGNFVRVRGVHNRILATGPCRQICIQGRLQQSLQRHAAVIAYLQIQPSHRVGQSDFLGDVKVLVRRVDHVPGHGDACIIHIANRPLWAIERLSKFVFEIRMCPRRLKPRVDMNLSEL